MADDQKTGSPQEEAIISRLRETPGQSPAAVTTYVGLLGRSPKQGYWLLYLSLDMSQWIEINEADIVHSEQLPADRSPFGSLGGTQVFVKANANVITSKMASVAHAANESPDDFDLDVQLGGSAATPALPQQTILPQQAAAAVGALATCNTCNSCVTCFETCHTRCGTCATCGTCQTNCNQATCATCNQATCVNTQCNQATCATCQTNCNQATCAQTQCNQATCATCLTNCKQATCNTCHTRCGTCVTCHTCETCPPPHHLCQ